MRHNFTARQRLAYYLTKNCIHDKERIRRVYLQSGNEHRVHSYELEAAALHDELEKEMNDIAASGVRMVFLGEKGFPSRLENISGGPIMLFVRSVSDLEELFDGPGKVFSAVVGTRDIDEYGYAVTRDLVKQYAAVNPDTVIVSGLAIGVDKIAHETALHNGLATIAVLPTSVDTVYPNAHARLGDFIARQEGCALVSPFAPGTEPSPVNFLLRNRVIAALCDNLTVTESKIKGGALVTAGYAADFNKPVYAVPGRLSDVRSEGCNYLINAGVAELLTLSSKSEPEKMKQVELPGRETYSAGTL